MSRTPDAGGIIVRFQCTWTGCYSEPVLTDWTPHSISKREASHPSEKLDFCCLYLKFHSFSWWLANWQLCFYTQLSLHHYVLMQTRPQSKCQSPLVERLEVLKILHSGQQPTHPEWALVPCNFLLGSEQCNVIYFFLRFACGPKLLSSWPTQWLAELQQTVTVWLEMPVLRFLPCFIGNPNSKKIMCRNSQINRGLTALSYYEGKNQNKFTIMT